VFCCSRKGLLANMNAGEENKRRIEKWKENKIQDWHKGGKLRQKFPDIDDLKNWMNAQVSKAKTKAASKSSRSGRSRKGPQRTT